MFVLKVLPLIKAFIAETFAIHRKSMKTAKLFSRVAFVAYSMSFQMAKLHTTEPILSSRYIYIIMYIRTCVHNQANELEMTGPAELCTYFTYVTNKHKLCTHNNNKI